MRFNHAAHVLAILSAALVSCASPASSQDVSARNEGLQKRATICNGHAELCERSYGSVTYVGTHDSYAVGLTSNLAVNQDQDITQQLNDGVRMLQMQAHNQGGVIRLCHSTCVLLDGGTLEDYLRTVKTWLDANPNEVLSLLIVNIDNLPASAYGTVFARVGLDTISYAPTASPIPATGWPTLGTLIDSGKRLLTFLDNGADLAAVPYLIDEFTNIWETEFNVVDVSRFNCGVNRTKGDTATQMFMINHFLDKLVLGQPVPFIEKLNETNAASGPGSLGAHVDTCVSLHTRAPTFLLVDFYEYGGGSVFEVAARINNVAYNPSTPIASPVPTTSGTRTGGTATNTGSPRGNAGSGATPAASTASSVFYVFSSLIIGGLFAGQLVL